MEKIKLDVGCGGRGTMHIDFVGIDIYPPPDPPRKPGTKYVQIDFIYSPRLPWAANTIDEIICFHVIEHVNRHEGMILLRRIHELLKPGAQAFIKCPDTQLFAAHYIAATKGTGEERRNSIEFLERTYPKNGKEMWPGETPLERFFFSMFDEREYGHRKPYDVETLLNVARAAGCTNVEEMPKNHYWAVNAHRDHECGIIITK